MKIAIILLTCVLSVITSSAYARDIKGVSLPESVQLDATTPALVLNGAGVRSKFVFSIYVGALYLSDKATSADAVLQQPGARRVSMHILYDEISKEKLVDGWNDGFRNNSTEQEFNAVRERLASFNEFFQTVVKGDVIVMDYLPGVGTRVHINDQLKGTIPGADFQRALLKVWLGNEPADDSLKQAMLGGE